MIHILFVSTVSQNKKCAWNTHILLTKIIISGLTLHQRNFGNYIMTTTNIDSAHLCGYVH